VGSLKTFSTVVLALCTLISSTARAQQQAQSDEVKQLIQNRDHKLSQPFLRSASWNTSYDEAKKAAQASGKLILGYFTRSYAPCGPCMQLEQTVFAKQEFIDYSKNVVLYIHISSRVPGEANGTLFAEKGGNAFPTLMVMDQDGNVLARQCGERSMRVVREVVAEGEGFRGLIERAKTGDLETRYECLCKQIQFGHFAPDVARAKVKDLGNLSADRKGWFESAIVSRECQLALLEIRKAPDESAQYDAAEKMLVPMKKAGHIPSDGNVIPFWEWIMAVASKNQDIALYEDGLNAMKTLLKDDAGRRERLEEKEIALERMKKDLRLGSAVLQSR
jgi:hypothetical protein